MRFKWDDSKNAANIRKHGIDFADAVDMFNHPLVEAVDDRYGSVKSVGSLSVG